MPRFMLGACALLAALMGCATPSPLLNSERIQARFGSYGVEVLKAGPCTRFSSLYSIDDGRRITRTFAIVSFADPVPEPLRAAHREIAGGASIGATLKAAGWRIEKPLLAIESLAPSDSWQSLYRLMDLTMPAALAVHSYRFRLVGEDGPLDYATISEIHSPAYLDTDDLWQIYGRNMRGGRYPVEALLHRFSEGKSVACDW